MPLPRIESETRATSIYELYNQMRDEDDQLVLDPPYQRGSVWTVEKQRLLWKTILMGLPIPAFYINRRGRDTAGQYVVDGQQRLRAIAAFLSDELDLPREWFAQEDLLDPASEQQGVTFSDLTRSFRTGLRTGSLKPVPVNLSHLPSEQDEAELFVLINSAGEEITQADLDRAAEVAKRA